MVREALKSKRALLERRRCLLIDLLVMLALVLAGFIPGYVAGVSHAIKKEEV